MPEQGITLINHKDILSYDEITETTKIAVSMGINKVRITGGEPLVRKDITRLVKMLAAIDGINDLAMTTNAVLLDNFALAIKEAGLMRVNISLDTINPILYKQITRGGDINAVFKGIDAAMQVGLKPIKINCVILKEIPEVEREKLKHFCSSKSLVLQFINKMNLGKGEFSKVINGEGGNCLLCNRLRLTANGKIKPCLFNDLEFDIRKLGAKQAIEQAIRFKPETGTQNTNNKFYNIGG